MGVLSPSGPAVVVELGNSEESTIQNINLNLANAIRFNVEHGGLRK
jgi:hypothetical protein